LKEARQLERLGQIVLRAGAHEGDRLIDLPIRGHENEGWRERTGVRDPKDLVTAHVRQPNVAEHEIRTKFGHLIHRSLSGAPPNGAPTLKL